MLSWLKNLMTPGAAVTQAAEPIDYEGFTIVATPRQVSGGWSTEGIIRRGSGEDARETSFIRADTCMSQEDAVRMSQAKARKIIDEQGERLFEGRA